ncbi:MAG: nucleotide exchange factor GrpE [Tannerella sp.]|jgi:molecular chaperone GrpE|nr:nucleotide exchange factor GrpE [Tannerella sp.]
MESRDDKNTNSAEIYPNGDEGMNTTNLQENDADLSENSLKEDNLAGEYDGYSDNKAFTEPSWEEKHASLNDSYLRLMAEFDNYRKRTIREKADLIKNGGETVLRNILPVIDDFDRALEALKKADDMQSIVEGVQLINDKFTSYLLQQGVKKMDVVGTPFDVDLYEAIATVPVPEADKKGKVIDCVQEGYMMYDKVLRYAKVVVGE